MSRQKAVSLLLQFATSLYLTYVGVASLINPDIWISYFPSYIHNLTFAFVLLKLWALFLLFLAIWIMSGKRIFIPTFVATIILILTTLISLPIPEYFFHNVALTCGAFSLCIIHSPRTPRIHERRRPA